MYQCEVCKRESFKKIRYGGYTLCSKHMHQLQKYHKFLDSNPRTQNDLNEYMVDKKEGIAIFDLYDKRQDKIGEFIIDLEDIEKVKYHKWRLSYGRVVTGNNTNKTPLVEVSTIVIGKKHKRLEHKDGDPLNNRKNNLVETNRDVLLERVQGVHLNKRKNRRANYSVEIRYQNKRYHLGDYIELEEAAYARYIAQNELFKEFSNNDNFKGIDFNRIAKERREQIKTYIQNKIQK